MKKFLISGAILCLAANAKAAPNFVVVVGEAQGWTSTSIQMDDRVPDSKSDFFQTPNLARLAQSGMRFSDAYAASPRCTPSRAALFTGKSPAQLHMTFVGEGKGDEVNLDGAKVLPPRASTELADSEITIAELLKTQGYATAHFGKWHVGRSNPARHGYDENDGANSNQGPENQNPNPKEAFAIAQRGNDFIARQVAAHKPFYLHLSHYSERNEEDALPATVEAAKRRTPNANERLIGQAAAIEDMDTSIGQVLDTIKALGIEDNTFVFYTADHGTQGRTANEPLRDGKGTIWEGGLRVPFLVRGPGIKANVCSHVRVIGEDLLPTIADFAGVKNLPANLEGGSLAPVLQNAGTGEVPRAHANFVVHFPHYDKDEVGPASAIYEGVWKLIRTYEDGALRLFDLSTDRSETRDLSKAQPEKTALLNAHLSDYLTAIGAQMPTPNPHYDPTKPPPVDRRGGKGGNKSAGERKNKAGL